MELFIIFKENLKSPILTLGGSKSPQSAAKGVPKDLKGFAVVLTNLNRPQKGLFGTSKRF